MARNKFYKRSDLIGKQIIDTKACVVGIVEDLAFDEKGGTALVVKKDGEERIIPMEDIKAVGDVILKIAEEEIAVAQAPIRATTPPAQPTEALKYCMMCGAANPIDARSCSRCGHKFEEEGKFKAFKRLIKR
jgi:sporulation protein YlmC with PRC-barrel domain